MILILQSDAQVPAGIYGDYLQNEAIPHRTVPLFAGDLLPEPAEATAVVVLGGRMGVHDEESFPFLPPLKSFMRQTALAGIPLLGICLGGQLLADALGGRVTDNHRGEKGMQQVTLTAAGAGDPLFAGLPQDLPFFAWHNDSFDLPAGAQHLAFSATCPGQAFRVGNAYGLQFHPEVNTAIVAAWSAGADGGRKYLADFLAAETVSHPICLQLFKHFLRLRPRAPLPGGRM